MTIEATRPKSWIVLGALLVAPLVATIVSDLVGWLLGYRTSFSLEGLGIGGTMFGLDRSGM